MSPTLESCLMHRRHGARDHARMKRLSSAGIERVVIGISGVVVPHAFRWGRIVIAPIASGVVWDSATYYAASGAWVAVALLPACVWRMRRSGGASRPGT